MEPHVKIRDINNSILEKKDHVAFATRVGSDACLKQGIVKGFSEQYNRVLIEVPGQMRNSRVCPSRVIKVTA
jgi:hypothetical protein